MFYRLDKKCWALALFLCSSALPASPAFAQQSAALSIGHTFAKSYPLTMDGEFAGCTIEFGKVASDASSGIAEPIYITGNIGFIAKGVLTLKVISAKIEGANVRPNPPLSAKLFSASATLADVDRRLKEPSATPGGLYQIYNLTPNTMSVLVDVIERQQIQLALNYGEPADVIVQLDLMRSSKELGQQYDGLPNDAVLEFVACTKPIAD